MFPATISFLHLCTRPEMVELLLNLGAPPDVADPGTDESDDLDRPIPSSTALAEAAVQDDFDVVWLLHRDGARSHLPLPDRQVPWYNNIREPWVRNGLPAQPLRHEIAQLLGIPPAGPQQSIMRVVPYLLCWHV